MPRKVILGFGISLDGYIARRNGAIDFLAIDKEGETLMAEFFAGIDTTIMGRRTAAATAEMRTRRVARFLRRRASPTTYSRDVGSRADARDSKW